MVVRWMKSFENFLPTSGGGCTGGRKVLVLNIDFIVLSACSTEKTQFTYVFRMANCDFCISCSIIEM